MQAEATFALELAPGNSLLVTGEKEEQTNPSPYFGFSFDLRTKTKSPVRTKGVEWLWMWRFEKAAISPLPMSPMTFQFPDCTECEAERLLGSFYSYRAPDLGGAAIEQRGWCCSCHWKRRQCGVTARFGMTVSTPSAIYR